MPPAKKRGKKTKTVKKKKLSVVALRRKQKKIIFKDDPDIPPGFTIKCHQNSNPTTCTKHVFDDNNNEVMVYTVGGNCPGGCPPI
jgi:hypothetical protein